MNAASLDYFDNGGATADRYSVPMPDGDLLVMSHNPSSPQGVCTYWKDAREQARVYRDNIAAPVRIVKRRVRIVA